MVISIFFIPALLCFYFVFIFPMIFEGLGSVGEDRLNRVPIIVRIAYKTNPYWVPALGAILLPFGLRSITNRKWKIVLIVTFIAFAFLIFKISYQCFFVYRSFGLIQ